MAQVIRFARARPRRFAALGTALLVPPLVCWGAVALVNVGLRPPAVLLRGLEASAGPGAEFALLLLCPLAAVAAGFAAIRRVPRGRKGAEAWCWAVIGVGLLCAICAVLAALRVS